MAEKNKKSEGQVYLEGGTLAFSRGDMDFAMQLINDGGTDAEPQSGSNPRSSLSSFIFFPNIIIKLLYLVLKTIFGRIDW